MESDLIEKYLNEGIIEKAKKELTSLKRSEKQGKLTKMGERRIEKIIDYLHRQGIFDV